MHIQNSVLCGMRFTISILVLVFISNISAHEADPSGLLAKYSLYGKEAVISAPNVETEPSGKGWVGSDGTFSGSGSTTTYGRLLVGGSFIPQGGSYLGGIEVEGDITSSGGTPVFGDPTNGRDTVRYNGAIPSNISGSPVLLRGEANVGIPEFPTYQVNPDNGKNCILEIAGWSGANCPVAGMPSTTALPPGRYGDITLQAGTKGRLLSGDYEFASLYVNDSLVIDKQYSQNTRIMVKGDFTLKSTNTGAIVTKLPRDYGRVLLYVQGMNVSTQQGQTMTATVVAPNAVVSLNPNFALFGQVMARQVNLSNGFNGGQGQFVSYVKVGVFIPGIDTLALYENTDDPNTDFGNNSRRIQIPLELTEASVTDIVVHFQITSSVRSPSAQISASSDLDTSRSRMASLFASGTVTFLAGNVRPTRLPSFWLSDDLLEEVTEYMSIRLDNAIPSFSASILGSDATGKAIWDIPILSDDGASGVPGKGEDPDSTVQTSSPNSSSSSISSGTSSSSSEITGSSSSTGNASSSSSSTTTTTGTITDSLLIIGDDTLHIWDSTFMVGADTVYTNTTNLKLTDPDGTDTTYVLQDGENWIEHSYTDEEGNLEIIRFPIILDTDPPKVEILSPAQDSGFVSPIIDVVWTVDGVEQNIMITETILGKDHWIIREASDRAGNVGRDSVRVHLFEPELKVASRIPNPILTDASENLDQIYRSRQRSVEPGESYSVSWLSADEKRSQEIVWGGNDNYEYANSNAPWIANNFQEFPGLQQVLTITIPPGLCDDGTALWNLRLREILLEEYDLQGQFVRKIRVPEIAFDPEQTENVMTPTERVSLLVQVAEGDAVMTAQNGRQIGTGVIILRTSVNALLEPAECNPLKSIAKKKQVMNRVGFIRRHH